MIDDLLPYFEKELTYFRHLAAEFASQHPQAAGQLSFDGSRSADPHVERLIQAFAFLNARVRHKLDDEFPELTDTLLQALYPHYLLPIPARGIVQFEANPPGVPPQGISIQRGAEISGQRLDGYPVPFVTSCDVSVFPLEVVSVTLEGQPFEAPVNPNSQRTVGVLEIVLRSTDDALSIAEFEFNRLRFFLHAAQSQNVLELYELLLENVVDIAVASGPRDEQAQFLGPDCLAPVGFAPDENVLPSGVKTFPGYRQLSEFFTFPERYLFVDLNGLTTRVRSAIGREMSLYFYIDQINKNIQTLVTRDVIQLNCSPAINLFPKTAEPIQMAPENYEYRIIADNYEEPAIGIHSITDARVTSPDDMAESYPVRPLYSAPHGVDQDEQIYWHAYRSLQEKSVGDLYLTLTQLNRQSHPLMFAEWTLQLQLLCFTREVSAANLQLDARGRPAFSLREGQTGISPHVQFLSEIKPMIMPQQGRDGFWKLISQLNLNHLSLADEPTGTESFRSLLKAHDFQDSSVTRKLISSLKRVNSKPAVGRVGGLSGGFARGIDVRLSFNEENLPKGQIYLLGNILNHFLGAYANINSFTRLSVSAAPRHTDEEGWQWNPRAGNHQLI